MFLKKQLIKLFNLLIDKNIHHKIFKTKNLNEISNKICEYLQITESFVKYETERQPINYEPERKLEESEIEAILPPIYQEVKNPTIVIHQITQKRHLKIKSSQLFTRKYNIQ